MKTDFESPLTPGYAGYCADLALDEAATQGVAQALKQAIGSLKGQLLAGQISSNAGLFHALRRLGQLQDMHNRLTGGDEDIEYLFSDDGECSHYVAGFLGDLSGVTDTHGQPLRVGDTVTMLRDGEPYEQMIILNHKGRSRLSQEHLNRHGAVFQTPFTEAGIMTAQRYSYPIIERRSCLTAYYLAQKQARAPAKQPHKTGSQAR